MTSSEIDFIEVRLNRLFRSNKFLQYISSKNISYVPSGFTFGVTYEDNHINLMPMCKDYGYDTYATGVSEFDDMSDYRVLDSEISEELSRTALEFIREEAPDIYNKTIKTT